MSIRLPAGRPPLVGPIPVRRPRAGTAAALRSAIGRAVARVRDLAGAVGSTALAGLDGVVVGLVVGYVIATTLSGPSKHLSLPWPVEVALAALVATIVAVSGAVAGRAARGLLLLAGSFVDRLLRRLPGPAARRWAASSRLRPALGWPGRLLRALPASWLGALAAVLVVANVGTELGPLAFALPVAAFAGFVMLAPLVAGLVKAAANLAAASLPRMRPSRWQRGAIAVLLVGALAATSYGGAVLLSPGRATPAVAADAIYEGVLPSTELDDPGAPGHWAVRSVAYGSGTDRLRPAFGAAVVATTPTVDASAVLHDLGWGADEAREWFWGFGRTELPLNGLAWLPVGEGPYPLVLMVHGNHAMGDFSEPGYAYLGEHLASRGFIAVSVDEDFLNGSWAGDWGGSEQLARAWFLLLHLDQWRAWGGDPASPFFGLVDLERVALLGHSRGGEAASVAAMLAGSKAGPPSGLDPWPTGLRVKAVVAIAPSDGQYDRSPVVLREVDYLTLHGGHDGDATAWLGIRQYGRTVVGEDGFRAAIWSYRSNHGQFNTTWGRSDHGDLGGALLDLGPILDPEAQRDIARTAIGAFLEASLHDQAGYRDLFRRPMVGRSWLPSDDVVLVRSSDDAFIGLTGGPPAGVVITPDGFESSRAAVLPLRALMPEQGTRGIELRWAAGEVPATWTLRGIAGVVGEGGGVALGLSLANGTLPSDGAPSMPLDPLIELTTTDGVTVALPLSRWGALPPPLQVGLVKSELLARLSSMDVALDAPPERILQTYEIPLAAFAAVDPAFVPERLDGLRIVIDREAPGRLWVAEVGIVAP